MRSATEQFKDIQTILKEAGLYTGEIDGVPGSRSDSAYHALRLHALSEPTKKKREPLPVLPEGIKPTIPKEAIALILESEGVDQPGNWPGGESGITLGRGDDIGADPQGFEDRWSGVIPSGWIERLKAAKGVTGEGAHALSFRFRDMKITREEADHVFFTHTLPAEIEKTLTAFPGAENLPHAALGALVSVVFNRGQGMGKDDGDPDTHDKREEMRAIKDALRDGVQAGDLQEIAKQLREMKRLWVGKGLDGLITRREAEAKLVESCIV